MKKVLKFEADWCGPCKKLSRTLELIGEQPIPVERVNIDLAQETAIYYGIKSVPTLVMVEEIHEKYVDFDGKPGETNQVKEIKRTKGGESKMTPEQLREWIND